MPELTSEGLDLQAALAGEYSLERELGRGGMGIVYLARDVQLDRHVAIKVLPTSLGSRPELRERFLREARMAAGLSHPNIVPIHRVGEAGGFVFFVMSYVPGETLGDRLRSAGPLPAADAARVLREVAWALAYAHGRGIVHRDVKPDNILLEAGTGRALVTDFGIAHGGGEEIVTEPGKIMGTAHFMSPEQAANGALDGRSDIYSLGVVGYLALSGRLPFETRSVPALLARQASERAPSVALAAPGLPSALRATIDRCLERDPAERFDSAEVLADALTPAPDPRATLPAPLRGWLGASNPANGFYIAWSGVTGGALALNLLGNLKLHSMPSLGSTLFEVLLASAPLLPAIGFHVHHARRLFKVGFSLTDLRAAIAVAEKERAEGMQAVEEPISKAGMLLRGAMYTTFTAGMAIAVFARVDYAWGPMQKAMALVPWISTIVLAAAANANNIPLLPQRIRRFFKTGLRDRLWSGRVGSWLARELHAPAVSRPIGAGVFRPTEILLGGAAADLFAALPDAYRARLSELPATVAALEARAIDARQHAESLAELAAIAGGSDAELLARRDAARAQLSSTVAALEGIRLDLLRLHAGASDLAPLTTMLDAAKEMADDIGHLADAQREVREWLGDSSTALERREPTPA